MASSLQAPTNRSAGVALIEAIAFMLIVGVAAGGVLSLLARTNQSSGEVLRETQAMLTAQALLDEVMAAPFTYCDPQDARFGTATSATVSGTGCASMVESLTAGGPEAGEGRYGPSYFDNLNDYHNLSIGPGILDRGGSLIGGLAGFSAQVSVQPLINSGTWNNVPAADVALITVTVTGTGLEAPAVVQGVRTRYAPQRVQP